ncbi:serine hydrolase [Erythrobacter sp. GH3-10]|uniref:Serine hydrolase n=2 Tax=Aurantiacibacter rhizosphaerae TaxID=2691582 RepID=A0A844XAM4_9SPHN|nr:serine hydrolase [Aurantiacibacter rhizosphaerae]
MKNRINAAIAALTMPFLPTLAHADDVSDLVEAELVRSQTPGIAIAVLRDGSLLRAQGFGEADIELHVPVHPDTLFKTGATGTQLTAAAIMLLVEDGKLGLDDPVTQYLPGAPSKWEGVTIRQLLNHTSGLPATPNGDFRADYTRDELLGIIAAQDINYPAGKRWRFSYAGYIVLGFVIEEVTGQRWSDFMQQRIFAPLGMHSARGIDEMAIIPNRSSGYELRDGELRNAEWISGTANSTADGSLYMSVLDYAAWAQAMSAKSLLSPASWQQLATSATIADGASCGYTPGWFQDSPRASQWHSGIWQGFQTYALRYPEQDLTVTVFANGDGADVQGLARRVAALTDPSLARQAAAPLADADPAETARARDLIERIVEGRAEQAEFADFAELDFTELTVMNAGILEGFGTLEDFALFDRQANCGETSYRYRARYADGLVEIRLGKTADGRINNLEILPLRDWAEPL